MNNNTLQHFGVLGMKWGVRRTETQLSKNRGTSKSSSDSKSKKSVKDMADDELKKTVNRLQMEKQYSQLSKENINNGKKYLDKIIKAGTTIATITTTALTIYNNVGKIKDIVKK